MNTARRAVRNIAAVLDSRTARLIALVLSGLVLVVGLGLATGLVTVYDGPGNAGVVVGTETNNVGYEWRGTPGLFVNGG